MIWCGSGRVLKLYFICIWWSPWQSSTIKRITFLVIALPQNTILFSYVPPVVINVDATAELGDESTFKPVTFDLQFICRLVIVSSWIVRYMFDAHLSRECWDASQKCDNTSHFLVERHTRKDRCLLLFKQNRLPHIEEGCHRTSFYHNLLLCLLQNQNIEMIVHALWLEGALDTSQVGWLNAIWAIHHLTVRQENQHLCLQVNAPIRFCHVLDKRNCHSLWLYSRRPHTNSEIRRTEKRTWDWQLY